MLSKSSNHSVANMSETIVVTGTRIPRVITVAEAPGFTYNFNGWDYQDGGGPTSGWDNPGPAAAINEFAAKEENTKDTPCVNRKPITAPLAKINRHAKAAGTALDEFRGTVEHATLIYEHEDGSIGKVPLFTSNQRNFVEINLDSVPPNANVVALVHNHVETPGTDQTYPSAADRQAMDRLYARANSGGMQGGISIDPHMLLYIYDEASRKTFAYDRDTMQLDAASCDL